MYRINSLFIFFLTETIEQHKERLLALVTFCLFFQRVLSLAQTSSGTITTYIEQHI